ncbi:MAG: hypothetical protein K2X00_21710 [Nitrospiraceae bacterium]|nr:hypothetical protein [Nitrospiraceae bacterium]
MFTLILIILLSLAPTLSHADDGDLQRALLEAACVNAKVTRLSGVGKSELYEANCLGTTHRRIKIVCTAGHCSADHPLSGRDESDD